MVEAAHCDFETASAADLRKVGVYKYVEHPSTRVWLFSYRFNEEPVARWLPGMSAPNRLLDHIARGGRFLGHNVNFERQVWNSVLRRVPGREIWPQLSITQCDCTMSRALAVHLPADLDTLAKVLGLSEQKDKDGSNLMRRMAKPRKIAQDGSITWWDSPENIERLGVYCDQDVRTESEVDKKLPPLSADERELWILDQKVNDRGVQLDIATIRKICAVLEVAKRRDNDRMARLTAGAVSKTTENAKLLAWFQGRGFQGDSIAKTSHADLRDMIDVFGDDEAAAVLDLRTASAKTSTAKYPKMIEYACADGRARGMFGYHRASTGRWGGSGPQFQNLIRMGDDDLPEVLALIDLIANVA